MLAGLPLIAAERQELLDGNVWGLYDRGIQPLLLVRLATFGLFGLDIESCGRRLAAARGTLSMPSRMSRPRGITANVVQAGLMEGGMEPPDPETLKTLLGALSLQSMGHPQEIAAAIAFLASRAASYVTGAVLDAHGGYNA
jgi:hypothetical protein